MARGLKGGEASIWTGVSMIGKTRHEVITRQRARHETRVAEFERLKREFGGYGPSGAHYWPEGMNRRTARTIVMDIARGVS